MEINRNSKNKDISKHFGIKNILINTAFTAIILSFSVVASANTHKTNNHENNANNLEILVAEVLQDTEVSLTLVENNTSESLMHVNKALASIKEIKKELSPDTHAKSKSPSANDSKDYWFIYPRVSENIFNNNEKFPTLSNKFKSNILYHGNINNNSKYDFSAYFDYAFAYASLLTAREALTAKNFREAKSSLKWVFEAIYINPDFHVVDFDKKLEEGQLININLHGYHPLLSNRTKVGRSRLG